MEAYLRLQKEFHDFLDLPELKVIPLFYNFIIMSSFKKCFSENSRTIYDLMASHGSTDDIIYFAKTMRGKENQSFTTLHGTSYLHVHCTCACTCTNDY